MTVRCSCRLGWCPERSACRTLQKSPWRLRILSAGGATEHHREHQLRHGAQDHLRHERLLGLLDLDGAVVRSFAGRCNTCYWGGVGTGSCLRAAVEIPEPRGHGPPRFVPVFFQQHDESLGMDLPPERWGRVIKSRRALALEVATECSR